MAAQKKLMAKGQIVTHLAEKFEISKKAAASIIDEYAALATAETKKKGAFVLPGIGQIRSRQKKGPTRPKPCHRRNNQHSGQNRSQNKTSQSL